MAEEKLEDTVTHQRKQMLGNFRAVFNTPQGKVVLDALKTEYYVHLPTAEPNQALVYNAERGVIQHIIDIVEQADGRE